MPTNSEDGPCDISRKIKTTSIPIPILFRYSVYVYLIIRKSGQRAFIQFWNWSRKRRQSFLRTNTLEFIKRERVDLSFECFSNGIERCERIYTNYCFPILVNSMKSYLHFIKKKQSTFLPFITKILHFLSHVFEKEFNCIDGETRNRNLEDKRKPLEKAISSSRRKLVQASYGFASTLLNKCCGRIHKVFESSFHYLQTSTNNL